MSVAPIITFKAGRCDLDESSGKATPQSEPGYIYLYADSEDLTHFCWRPRSAGLDDPDIDLIMFPSDGNFTPYQKQPTTGRIYVLKFSSSSERHLFWLQSKSQAPNGDPSYFSSRDLKLGEVVNSLLQGEDVDVQQAVAEMRSGHPPNDDDDETMEDVEGHGNSGGGSGALGGNIRGEGEDSREGGADGGRAAGGTTDAQSIIQNFIKSMPSGASNQGAQQKLFTTLQDLMTPTTTVAWIDTASEEAIDQLLQFLPPNLPALATDEDEVLTSVSLDLGQKKQLVKRVLRSPQFTQSLASLTFALRDGGLPSIGEALNVPLQNGGYMRRGGVPLGGGDAVEAFIKGVRDLAEDEDSTGDEMETS